MRRNKKVPEYKLLKVPVIKNETIKVKIEAEYEVDLGYFLDESRHLPLSEDVRFQKIVLDKVASALFDDSWGRLTANKVKLTNLEADPALVAAFEDYRQRYFKLKTESELEHETKEIAELKSKLAQLEGRRSPTRGL